MDMQNVSNLVIPEGNVRTIHDKDNKLIWGRLAYDTKYSGNTIQNGIPSPDSPQAINVVTGTQTVTVSGKNLLDIQYYQQGSIDASTGVSIASNRNGRGSNYIPVQPNTTYTFSANTSMNALRLNEYTSDKTNIIRKQETGNTQLTVTTSANTYFVRWSMNYDNTTVMTEELANSLDLQLEFGSSRTTYELYQSHSYTVGLGSIELCKIGTYQDYIYKTGDDWYVHKAINKVILNGSETWGGGNGKYSYSDSTIVAQPLGVDEPPIAVSNYLVASNYTAVVNDLADNIIAGYYNGGQFRTRVTSYATANDWKTWLTTHNLTVYYQLATPTDTQITDTNLITQLNNIHQFLTRYGYNSNVSGNLPIIIDKTDLS